MPTPFEQNQDNPTTYFVQDRNNEAEMIRLQIQDTLITAGMGGPLVGLVEKLDPGSHILDLGCGPGGWLLEAAAPGLHSGVGIDMSWRMIQYAQSQAQARNLHERATFRA